MGNLVPEQRTDKNGHLVTRHVKSGNKTSALGSHLPKPSIPASAPELTPAMQTRVTNQIIKATGDRPHAYLNGNKIITNTLAYLARRSPEEFLALNAELKTADPWLRLNWGATLDSISFAPPRHLTGEAEKDMLPYFRRTKVIVGVVSKLTEDDGIEPDGTALRGAALRGLISKIEPDDEDTVRAALVATWILPRTPNGSYAGTEFAPDDESLEFIKANYERVMDYRHVLRTRGSIDPEVMSDILSTRTPSISSGVL